MPRQKAFHPDAALDRAMDLFWRKGFEGASLSALLAAMEISRQSLYNTFGNKQVLFLAVLDRYGQMQALQRLHLEQESAGLGSIRAYFDRLISGMEAQPEYGACLMSVAAVELGLQDWAVKTRVEAHNAALSRAFLSALQRAESRGALRPKLDLGLQADQLVALSRGLGVMARSGMTLARLRMLVDASLGLLATSDEEPKDEKRQS